MPQCAPIPSGCLPQLDYVVVWQLQIPSSAIPTGISLYLYLYLGYVWMSFILLKLKIYY